MKQIRSLTNQPVVINNITIDPDHPMKVWNEEILESAEVKQLLKDEKIEIINDLKLQEGKE